MPPKPTRPPWAEELRAAKKRQRLTVKKLCRLTGTAHGTVVKILQGQEGTLLRHIRALAQALDLELTLTFTPGGGAQLCRCAGCSEVFRTECIHPLHSAPHLFQQLVPGAEVPAGCCPRCASPCYYVKAAGKPAAK